MASHGFPFLQQQHSLHHSLPHSSAELINTSFPIEDSPAMQPPYSSSDETFGSTAVAAVEKAGLSRGATLDDRSNSQISSPSAAGVTSKDAQESSKNIKSHQYENGEECYSTDAKNGDHSVSNGYTNSTRGGELVKRGEAVEHQVSGGSNEEIYAVASSSFVADNQQNFQQRDASVSERSLHSVSSSANQVKFTYSESKLQPVSMRRPMRSAKRFLSEQSEEKEAFDNPDNSSEISEDENDNESTCGECHGGGELVCCDGCIKAYHAACLSPSKRPRLDSDGDWYCPMCISRRSQPGKRRLEKKDLSNFQLPPLASSIPSSGINSSSGEAHSASSIPSLQVFASDPLTNSASNIGVIRTSYPSLSRSPSAAVPVVETRYFRRKKKPIDEGPKEANRINIGPRHQVPCFPAFFLNRDEDDTLASRAFEEAKLVYSPFSLERMRKKRLIDGGGPIIRDDSQLSDFVMYCAKTWRAQEGWQPFSPEFAYKLLHSAEYDPERAIKMMKEPQFRFDLICDPPRRKYENKWKPKDRRGGTLTSPYPPPGAVKSYFSRRTNTSYMLR
ncbi:hypothetical protein IE077_002342 [Cardiosporidium cionae]|uniref:PHD-type domain-containing protein n=1 Tax=Cardiosporidium cionae TaxID=476202 RepID=A0ABQ7JG47_9APIC|nr:hypothetical protein IE077_002342 [Cardiosporidium cionae]|eukprot:KAF8822854.1 hypothetical protein IE077_002342 [Cardiosporidium cionae]